MIYKEKFGFRNSSISKNADEHNKLIITEGKDDMEFICYFLEYLSKKNNKKYTNKIWTHFVGGKDKLLSGDFNRYGLELIAQEKNFKDYCQKIAIIFDADNNPQKRLRNLEKQISSLKITKEISVFLIPNHKDKGCLEDLYLSTLDKKDQQILECIKSKNIDECLLGNKNANQTKLLTQILLTTKDVKLKSIGLAASYQKINFASKALEPLKNFLINFANS